MSENSIPVLAPNCPRVLHVVTGLKKGGAEKIVTQLATSRGSNGAIAWLSGPNQWDTALDLTSVSRYPLTLTRLKDLPGAVRLLSKAIRTFRPDIVHTHLTHAHLVGRWASRRAGIIAVSTEHNLRNTKRFEHRLLNRIDARTSRYTEAILAISRAVHQCCETAGIPKEKLQVIYNGVQTSAENHRPSSCTRPVVAMVGRLHHAKGADVFVRAMAMIDTADSILVGDGPQRDLIQCLSADIHPASRFRWEPDGDASAALAHSNVVVVPSRSEGLGLVALEAMALGRAVVAAKVGGLPEVVLDGVTGVLFQPDSPEAAAESVSRLLNDPDMRDRMGQAGRARVEERFTLKEMLSRYEDIYRSISK